MSDNSRSQNKHTFTWIIESFEETVTLISKDMKEMRSPIFTAETLDRTSWFLRLNFVKKKDSNRATVASCHLVRNKEDGGAEIVIICWRVEISNAEGHLVPVAEEMTMETFKRGNSATCGEFNVKTALCKTSYSYTLRCHLSDYFHVQKPLSASTLALTKLDSVMHTYNLTLKFDRLLVGPLEILLLLIFPQGLQENCEFSIKRIDDNASSCSLVGNLCISDSNYGLLSSKHVEEWFESHDKKDYTLGMTHDILKHSSFVEFHYYVSFMTLSSTKSEDKHPFVTTCTAKSKNSHPHVTIPFAKSEDNHNFLKRGPTSSMDTVAIFREDVLRMYANSIQTDVQLRIGNDAFPAHKCVLATRSPVFSTMFEQDMLESQAGFVDITDVDAKTLNLLLKFIYSGTADELDCESALKLILAAEKYQVLSLKEACSILLDTVISEENVCEILTVADMVSHGPLKSIAMDYIKEHVGILLSDKWKKLVGRNVNLVAEILQKLSVSLGTAARKS